MILDTTKYVAALKKAMETGDEMAIAFEVVIIMSAGMEIERERVIRIIQQHAICPLPVIERIRRPVR